MDTEYYRFYEVLLTSLPQNTGNWHAMFQYQYSYLFIALHIRCHFIPIVPYINLSCRKIWGNWWTLDHKIVPVKRRTCKILKKNKFFGAMVWLWPWLWRLSLNRLASTFEPQIAPDWGSKTDKGFTRFPPADFELWPPGKNNFFGVLPMSKLHTETVPAQHNTRHKANVRQTDGR